MNNEKHHLYNTIIIFFLLYLSLVVGFYFDENLSYGAKADWFAGDLPVIRDLSIDLKHTILNYDAYGHRHSPTYLVFLSLLKRIGFSFDVIRFIHLNISISLILVFYKCLRIKFEEIDKNLLLVFACFIFLSPNFRSLAIWPSSRIIGLVFFTLSLTEFLKFKRYENKKYVWSNITLLILSSYLSPNFAVFYIYFLFHYLNKLNFRELFILLTFSFISSIPFFYYIFILDVNFLLAKTPGFSEGNSVSLSFNFSDKILIISSIVLFYFLPFLIDRKLISDFLLFTKKYALYLGLFFFGLVSLFDYRLNYTGGGVFFQSSILLFNNNYLFYLISFISISLIFFFSKNNINNFIIFFLLIISNVQNTIYHKYYDPLVVILLFSVLTKTGISNFFLIKKRIKYLYYYYIFYILMRLIKNNFYN